MFTSLRFLQILTTFVFKLNIIFITYEEILFICTINRHLPL